MVEDQERLWEKIVYSKRTVSDNIIKRRGSGVRGLGGEESFLYGRC